MTSQPSPALSDPPLITDACDPHLWLEDVEGEAQLAWVRERNAESTGTYTANSDFATMQSQLRAVLDSDQKIPAVSKIGDFLYNFWTDSEHERGLWRRTTLDSYRTDSPDWETVLDIDALGEAEGVNWVWHGASVLRPEYRKTLVSLSRGGADADVTREFDLVTKEFISPADGGFFRPESKGDLAWIDDNTVYVFADFGEGTMTTSGYPRIAKRWTRGTMMSSATTIYEGLPEDMYISAFRSHTPSYVRDFVSRSLAFYNSELFLLGPDDALIKIDVPNSAEIGIKREWLLVELREDWSVGGRTYVSGALIAAKLDAFLAGDRDFTVLFAPQETTSLTGLSWTKNHLVLNVLDDVKNRLHVLTPPGDNAGESNGRMGQIEDTPRPTIGDWQRSEFVGAPDMGTVNVGAVDPDDSDDLWMVATNYLTPSTLSLMTVGDAPELLKSMPHFFDNEDLTIEQNFATSDDGTRVPYFLVRRSGLAFDGTAPTLMWGYGGFETALTPSYSGVLGRAWLAKGGVYVVANIRGGGEYGPRWHQLALKENRHRAYEDFSSVAKDLVARKVTSREHLGMQGRSNGGLLAGNMLTQYPDLFGAVVVQVPLLDMKRYSHMLAGASWMAEYGDPDDPAQWEFIKTFSPYHLFDPAREYPPTLITTSTRDDRVHPGHARKLAAAMSAAGKDVSYYENIEGGHGGAANNEQAAFMEALAYHFLWEKLA
jgi:prolyl oligopeptidase